MNSRFILLCIIAISALLALPVLAAPDYTKIEARVQSMHIIPNYQALAGSTGKMATAIQATCAPNASIETMLMAQGYFQTTLDDWQSIQHFRSGPVALDDRHSRLQFWPDKRSIGGRHLSRFLVKGSNAELAPEKMSTASVALQGFPALERLLFDDMPIGLELRPDEILSRCHVAISIANNIAMISTELLLESQRAHAFGTESKLAVRAMVNDLITGVEVIQRLKIQMPMGKTKPLLKRAENWRSARSLRNIELNLKALRALTLALNDPADTTDPESKLIYDQFDIAIATARNLGADMGAVLRTKDGVLKLRSLALTLDDLKKLIAIYMTDRLSVNLGFNSLDGD